MVLLFLLFRLRATVVANGLLKECSRLKHHLSHQPHLPPSIIRDPFSVCSIATRSWSLDPPIALASYGISRPGTALSVSFAIILPVFLMSALIRNTSCHARKIPPSVCGIKKRAISYGSSVDTVDQSMRYR